MKTGRYSIKDLLTHNEIDQIIIPEIQRDYVWEVNNVEKLLASIFKNYKNKKLEKLELNIEGNSVISTSIKEYLQKEYSRLKHNTKIGFIYAYHDNEYAGNFFLIDGQQRMTTIYLLLLSIYVISGKEKEFETLYFKNGQLKIDYKVRENSHEFMSDFVKHQLDRVEIPFKSTAKYYSKDYDDDATIKNLLNNFELINNAVINLKNENVENENREIDSIREYVEDYIEVNYFDTNLSEQGEQLYLYMNSRGEYLSHQEKIKSEIIRREPTLNDKKRVGQEWEEMQNFFWQHRKAIDEGKSNENADLGFEEFLKWCSIIHICTTSLSEGKIIRKTINEKKQGFKEAKTNYIHLVPDRLEEQKRFLVLYQQSELNGSYIYKYFKAIKHLMELTDIKPIKKGWLSSVGAVRDYIVLLPLLYFISNNEWENKEQKRLDVSRLAMFLENLPYSPNVRRSPDSITVEAIGMVKELCDSEEKDIIFFLDNHFDGKFNIILSSPVIRLLEVYKQLGSHRTIFEKIIWRVINKKNFAQFFTGDYAILFNTVDYHFEQTNAELKYDDNYCHVFDGYWKILQGFVSTYEVDKNGKQADHFRRALLTFGDYSVTSTGSYKFRDVYLNGYSLGYSHDADNKEYIEIFNGEKSLVRKLLYKLYNDNEATMENIHNNYVRTGDQSWIDPFITYKNVLSYMNYKRILRGSDEDILILSHRQSGYVELQCHILKNLFSHLSMEIFQHNICYINFDFIDESITPVNGCYSIVIKYKDKTWSFSLLYRNTEESVQKLNLFTENNWGTLNEDLRLLPVNDLIYTDDSSLSIIENVKKVKERLDLTLEEIRNILIKQLTDA